MNIQVIGILPKHSGGGPPHSRSLARFSSALTQFSPTIYTGLRMWLVSLCGGMITAYWTSVYVTDGRVRLSALLEPSSYGVAAICGGIGGFIMFPFTWYCLKDRQLFPAVLWLYLLSSVGSLAVTALSLPPGILWNFIIAAIGLSLCKILAKPRKTE
jgi:hypothetical protein